MWRNSRAFARDQKGRWFESLQVRFQVTVLGMLFTRMYLSSSIIWYRLIGILQSRVWKMWKFALRQQPTARMSRYLSICWVFLSYLTTVQVTVVLYYIVYCRRRWCGETCVRVDGSSDQLRALRWRHPASSRLAARTCCGHPQRRPGRIPLLLVRNYWQE